MLFKELMEDLLVTDQQGKSCLVEPMEACHLDWLFTVSTVQQGSEQPKAVFFFAPASHEDKASHKVERLAVADVWVVDCIRLKDVAQDFLPG